MGEREDAKSNYAGVFEGRIGFGERPALLIIDMVEAYFDPRSPLYARVEDTLAAAIDLRAAARAAGVPVIHTNVVYHPSMRDGGRFARKVGALANFVRGNAMGAWARGLEPAEDELVVSKQYASAFFGTSLASTLTAAGHDSVVIAGVSTSGCIRASCVDACQHGFIPLVVEEAVGDRHEDVHRANLFDMNAKYGDVVTLAEAKAHFAGLAKA
ncbi:isochorismatase family protein [Erythrobacter sp. HL-111]|uniref:isochorismatase family protein n=1 Tax=Erythrobacter sp. HL-111 TaxID=1798193 RepID=UPI0006DADD92|nr:isochorismatase family protein [Erythrobacter sp. HL-111]KPP92546.1 MAG: maleamate amidohydrolase NicF [Erythrobacteraceae bacterium HL-111]SDS91362.1 Isochorismate hydrolase [Erythrobacter sp. HL-111]